MILIGHQSQHFFLPARTNDIMEHVEGSVYIIYEHFAIVRSLACAAAAFIPEVCG